MPNNSDDDAGFVGSIPQHYDRGLGPNLFVDYAADIAKRAAALQPTSVLELAAGTGIVTRRLRDLLPQGTGLTATDLNPPMLEVAAAKFADGDDVTFRPADATALPFDDQTFDLVVCQFGVMFFPDKDQSYHEVQRVLKPGGRYLFSVWDSVERNPFSRIIRDTVASFFDNDPPGFMKVPTSYFAIDPIKHSLQAAGFAGIDISVVCFGKDIADVGAFARGAIYGNPLIDQIRMRGSDPDRVVAALIEAFVRAFGKPARMPLQAIVFTALKPTLG
jgi:ubiquinone/menaquinone biosynthesis C-methylase UbiE